LLDIVEEETQATRRSIKASTETVTGVQGINDKTLRSRRPKKNKRRIGTTFEALNLQAYSSKASAAPKLEKRPAPLVGVCD
jgi:hypothetical protein